VNHRSTNCVAITNDMSVFSSRVTRASTTTLTNVPERQRMAALDIDMFYVNESHNLKCDSSRARDEITLFARRAGDNLYQCLPHLPRVPHRVRIVDERDKTDKSDQRTLLQAKQKHIIATVRKRRHLLKKMMHQAASNQTRIQRIDVLTRTNSTCARELIEHVEHIERAFALATVD
jgi:hypothetical protein